MNVRVFCHDCGDVVVDKKGLQVRICAETQQCSYNFFCPGCTKRVARRTTLEILQKLVNCGVKLKVWHLPDELRQIATGPNFTIDDVIDFHFDLQDLGWIERQIELCGQTAEKLDNESK